MSDAVRRRIQENNGHGLNYGKHFSKQARKNISKSQKKLAEFHRQRRLGVKMSEESVVKRTAKRLENNGGLYAPNEPHSKAIKCVETGEVFRSINELSRFLNISRYYTRKFVETEQPYGEKHYQFIDECNRKEEKELWHSYSKKLNESKSESKLVSQALLDQGKQ